MNLYLDMGNTRIKWMLDTQQQLIYADSITELKGQWREIDMRQEKVNVFACSVRGESEIAKVDMLAKQIIDVKVQWIHSSAWACGVKNAYLIPEQLGADRWLALIGARARYPFTACIIVDAGTAVTVDLIDEAGQHRGGVILPGVTTLLESLGKAEQLYPDSAKQTNIINALSTSTQSGIISGVVFSVQGGVKLVIEQQISQINERMSTIPILVTGGDASLMKVDLQQVVLVPNLVLEGLHVMAEYKK